MKREKVLKKTVANLHRLSETELREVSDFVDFLVHRIASRRLTQAIQEQAARDETFNFLEEEEELYSENDLSERYK